MSTSNLLPLSPTSVAPQHAEANSSQAKSQRTQPTPTFANIPPDVLKQICSLGLGSPPPMQGPLRAREEIAKPSALLLRAVSKRTLEYSNAALSILWKTLYTGMEKGPVFDIVQQIERTPPAAPPPIEPAGGAGAVARILPAATVPLALRRFRELNAALIERGIFSLPKRSSALRFDRKEFNLAQDKPLLAAWPKILQQLLLLPNPPAPLPSQEADVAIIRVFLNNPAHAAFLRGVTTLDLSNIDLRIVPPEIECFQGLIILKFDRNYLNAVPDFSLPNLQELDLYDNNLTTVPDFSRLPNLERLELCYNRLLVAPNFSHLINLRVLNLAGNRFTDVPDFSYLPVLVELFLYANKQLTAVPDFSHIPNLQILDLSGCHLTAVHDFLHLPNLRNLNLIGNHLTAVPNFSRIPLLEYLELALNLLETVHDLSNLPNLRRLNLMDNKLTEKPQFSHHRLQLLDCGNPIDYGSCSIM